MRRTAAMVLLALLELGVPGAEGFAQGKQSRAAEARRLYEKAVKRMARGAAAQNQMALRELEQAALLDPGKPEYALAAGRFCLQADMLHQARHWGQTVLERDSSIAGAHFLIGSIWRRDWLITADERSLDRAIIELGRAARMEASRSDHWLTLVPLLVERGELVGARGAAGEAWEADSSRAETWLARAYTLQRSGELAQAMALFDQGLARLPASVRKCFEDLTPLLPPPVVKMLESASPGRRAAFARKFWDDADPDLVTPANEARLEFLARATHAYFLYYRPRSGAWDTRGDLYVRFGPPRWSDRNPALALTYVDPSKGNWMVWGYPELGMRIWMQATNPLGSYQLPHAPGGAIPRPFPDSLTRRPDLHAVAGGYAVFPRIPPGAQPITLRCALARFEAEGSRRLLAHVECPGSPAESLQVEWAVYDTLRRERARESRWMTASACAPTEARAGSFAADLPPGRYHVGVSVRDGVRRHGVFASAVEIGSVGEALGLSDVVVACGPPQAGFAAGQAPRLEVNPGARLRNSDQVTAYFEIYHLAPGPGGWSRFEYVYTVRSAEQDSRVWLQRALAPRRLPPPIEASREEETSGPVRRQYVTVPIRGLPSGRYEIEIRVRDLISGASVAGKAQFTREG